MIKIPVDFILNGPIPDIDVLRTIILSGSISEVELRKRLRLDRGILYHSLGRLHRRKLVVSKKLHSGAKSRMTIWFPKTN